MLKKNHRSLNMKKYWSNISAEKRTELGKARASKRWMGKTPEERKRHAMKMVKARAK